MALTAWETAKVLGDKVNEMGVEGEKYEDAHPGEKWQPSRTWLLGWAIDLIQKLGVEVVD